MGFTEAMFVARRGVPFVVNHHHQEICNALLQVFIGRINRLVINLPPRYSKTELAVVHFMAWALGHFPDSEFIHASYSKRLATNNAYAARSLVMSAPYQRVFPGVRVRDGSRAKDEWRTLHGGLVYATGAEGTITGYGAGKLRPGFGGALIIDDPHKPAEVESKTMRENVINWFQNTMESRLNSRHTAIIVIMQRLHQEDLAGWLLAGGNGEHWHHICLPAIDQNGDALWPEKHGLEELRRMEQANPFVFAGQYLQRPVPRSGGLFKVEWVERFDCPPGSDQVLRTVQSWDTAYKPGQLNDPSVCTTWAETRTGYYLLDAWRGRVEYPVLKRRVIELASAWRPEAILVEDKASGQSLLQELKANTRLPVIAVKPEGDKVTRASEVSALFESGRVYLPSNAPWLGEYEAELFTFPMSKHDDQVDSSSQALRWMRDSNPGYAWDRVVSIPGGVSREMAEF